jgi:hypothetical protein
MNAPRACSQLPAARALSPTYRAKAAPFVGGAELGAKGRAELDYAEIAAGCAPRAISASEV